MSAPSAEKIRQQIGKAAAQGLVLDASAEIISCSVPNRPPPFTDKMRIVAGTAEDRGIPAFGMGRGHAEQQRGGGRRTGIVSWQDPCVDCAPMPRHNVPGVLLCLLTKERKIVACNNRQTNRAREKLCGNRSCFRRNCGLTAHAQGCLRTERIGNPGTATSGEGGRPNARIRLRTMTAAVPSPFYHQIPMPVRGVERALQILHAAHRRAVDRAHDVAGLESLTRSDGIVVDRRQRHALGHEIELQVGHGRGRQDSFRSSAPVSGLRPPTTRRLRGGFSGGSASLTAISRADLPDWTCMVTTSPGLWVAMRVIERTAYRPPRRHRPTARRRRFSRPPRRRALPYRSA